MTAIVSPPVFKYQVAFANNPLDTGLSFTDISPYVIDFHFKYGRQFELNRFETGTADFKLDNTDRRFDPSNTSSPYSPNIKPLKLFQVTAPSVLPIDGGTVTVSGNEITDTVRSAATSWLSTQQGGQVDGATVPGGFYIDRAATNDFTRGQCDSLGVPASGIWAIAVGAAGTAAIDATTQAPWSPQSLKCTGNGSAAATWEALNGQGSAIAAGTTLVGSVLASLVAGQRYTVFMISINTDATLTNGTTTTTITAGDGSRPSITIGGKTYELLTAPAMTVAAGKTCDRYGIRVQQTAGRSETVWLAHAMLEHGQPYVAPYVATSGGATATNAASLVSAPVSLLSSAHGWVVVRLRMGFSAAAATSNGVVFAAGADASNRIQLRHNPTSGKWEAAAMVGGAEIVAQTPATFNLGDFATVVMAWGTFGVAVSVNGGPLTVAASSLPSFASTFFIGSASGSATPINSSVLWFGCGTGSLTNTDIATVNAIPNTISTWNGTTVMQPVGDATSLLWPPNCSLTAVWPALTTTYRVPSIAYVWTGYITSWPSSWEGPSWAEIDCTASDALQVLALAEVVSSAASLTTNLLVANGDVTFTCRGLGSGGNAVTVSYVNNGTNPPTVTATGLNIQVNMSPGVSTANGIINAVNADGIAGLLVTASLPPGSTGLGTPGVMAPTNLSGGTFAQAPSGTQIGAVLDAIKWPSTWRSVDTGVMTVAATMFKPGDHQKAQTHINDIENSELGYVYVTPRGYIAFHDQHHRLLNPLSTVSNAIFGDSATIGAELEYDNLVVSYDDQYIYNYVGVTPYNGSNAQISQDLTSQANYVIRSYTLSTNLTSASDALEIAQLICFQYKQPGTRVTSMTYTPMNDVGLWLQFFSRTIGDRITVRRRPPSYGAPAGPTLSTDVFLESIEGTFNPGLIDFQVRYELSPAGLLGSFIVLDDPVFGMLDSTNILT